MKPLILTYLLTFLSFGLMSQNDEGKIINGRREGKFILDISDYYFSGILHANFSKGLIEGEAVLYQNGKLVARREYRKGVVTGNFTEYESNGIIKRTGVVKDGIQECKYYFYKTKTPKYVIHHKFKMDLRDSICTLYPVDREEYEKWKNQYFPRDGIFDQTYSEYINHGKFTAFYETGEVWLEQNFIDGKRDGNLTEYYINGTIKSITFISTIDYNDLLRYNVNKKNSSDTVVDFRDFDNHFQTTYPAYDFVDKKQFYDETGKLQSEYSINIKDTITLVKYYSEKGNLISLKSYKDVKIGNHPWDDTYIPKRNGDWFTYYKNGTIKSKVNYLNDEINLYWIDYNKKGKVLPQKEHEDFIGGKIIRYDKFGKLIKG